MTTQSAAATARATVYGYPRQGQDRELKEAIEGYWKGSVSADALHATAAGLRHANRRQLAEAGIDEVPTGDLVQYFAEQLTGCLATRHGWVQSYGTRYVRPPNLAGDISRPEPMTVRWTTYAQSLTSRPVKGMLTGPVTMLAWSFVRDDQSLADTARQVALALRDEVTDLEAAGTAVIQVDEPALRETLPLRTADRAAYLAWATEAFRLTTAGVRPDTQIHTPHVLRRGGRRAAAHRAGGHPGGAAVGQPRLRPEDPRLARDPRLPGEPGGRRPYRP